MDILIEELEGGLWVAATEKGRLQGLEIDPPPSAETVRWGSIYRAKIERIDKAMDAAFVSLGNGLEAILHNKDVRKKDSKGQIKKGGDVAIGKLLRAGQMIVVQAKSGFFDKPEEFEFMREDKRPVVSMDITLPGRYLIYAPMSGENQVSSRIRDAKLRKNLLAVMKRFEPLKGYILRAASENTQFDILLREAKILDDQWQKLQTIFGGDSPGPIAAGPDAFQRVLGDQAITHIDRIEVVTMDRYKQVENWAVTFGPDLVPRIQPVEIEDGDEELALFEYRGILGDIEELFQEYALLPGGGSLILQHTAALTAIDVNRGADTRPVLAVNLEAAQEIARQIRLRNMGGIIVIDFLKFTKKAELQNFVKKLTPIFDTDPCTVQIHGATALGLVEITRKRRTPPLSERLDTIDTFMDS